MNIIELLKSKVIATDKILSLFSKETEKPESLAYWMGAKDAYKDLIRELEMKEQA